MDRTKRARLELIVSVVMFGTLPVFVRHIALGSAALALCRAVLAALLIGLWLLLRGERLHLAAQRRELLLLFASGAAMGVNWILLFEAYKYTSVSAATLSYYFAPVLVTAVCPLLFGEKLGGRQILCSVFATLGVALIVGAGGLGGGASDLRGVLLGLGAAVFYATVILLNKFIKSVAGIQRTFLQFLAAIAVLLPYVLLSGGLELSGLDGVGWGCLLIVGLVHTGVTYCLYFSSLKELPGQEAAVLSYLDPLVAVLASVCILGETMGGWQLAGGALILGFAVVNELPPRLFAKRERAARR